MEKEVLQNHKRYLERVNFYRSFGYDLEKERDFILDKSLPISGKILEIGTGKGHFALALAKRGFSFISIDISKEEQEIAKLNIQYFGLEKQVVLRIEDAGHLSFPDQSFDTIFSINVFHHLEEPLAVLDEVIRLLRPAGKAVLSDFNKEGMVLMDKIHASEGNKHEVSNTTLSDIEHYLITKGFRINKANSRFQEVLIVYHQLI